MEISYAFGMSTKRVCESRGNRGQAEEDILLAGMAAAMGEPARMRILLSLMDGHARTSTELSVIAEVAPSTASAHLSHLMEKNLIGASAQGRHRYYSLRGAEIARVIESLGVAAGAGIREFVPKTPEALRRARSCYDHLAGTLAVKFHDSFLRERWLIPSRGERQDAWEVSELGRKSFRKLGIDVDEVRFVRRRFAYPCMDWSERKPHLAGALGAAFLKLTLARKWLVREPDGRALSVSRMGEREIWTRFGISI